VRSSPHPLTRWVFVAHNNYNYDKKVLDQECARVGTKVPPEWRMFDTFFLSMSLQKGQKRGKGFHKLVNLAQFYQVPPREAHRAMSDVLTMYDVFQKMIGGAPEEKVNDAMFEPHPIIAVAQIVSDYPVQNPTEEVKLQKRPVSPPISEMEIKDEIEEEVILADVPEEAIVSVQPHKKRLTKKIVCND